ncbi:carnitine O-palmitoyltransferase 1, liver isoform [Platysternon megacephalum]|uniref:Carnitine O-palmitoyltransferase 1, liver isoform n=1 Tax=Platysternon megacephalum TaxID=55544 RepID=A0A4D9DVS6_9SAUR|nr:carnitine O-palmitoyltransferase 1, liver isoform [Platysternon megacephalum]
MIIHFSVGQECVAGGIWAHCPAISMVHSPTGKRIGIRISIPITPSPLASTPWPPPLWVPRLNSISSAQILSPSGYFPTCLRTDITAVIRDPREEEWARSWCQMEFPPRCAAGRSGSSSLL